MKSLMLASLLLLVSCAKNNSLTEIFKSDLFSNRDESKTQFIAIIRLQEPALLQKDGSVDAEALKRVELEQTQKITELQALSSEIKVIYRYRLVLNAIAIVAPMSVQDAIKKSSRISYVEETQPFARPKIFKNETDTTSANGDISNHNSRRRHSRGSY